jgi:CHC2 zinc finger
MTDNSAPERVPTQTVDRRPVRSALRIQDSPLAAFLSALYSRAPAGSLVEVRYRTPAGMGQIFRSVTRLDHVAAQITHSAPRTDVYVGVLPRRRRGGRRNDLVDAGQALWVDCDTPDSVHALQTFLPVPSMVVRSGTASNCHGYWLLNSPVSLDDIEDANRHLAHALCADAASADAPRILRPPSALNHKHDPPIVVHLQNCDGAARYCLDDVVQHLPEKAAMSRVRVAPNHESLRDTHDRLRGLAPQVYVEQLTGSAVPRTHKINCPFHPDRTPSLHVYDEPERGWTCFGCHRGGGVYDFAAYLWGMTTRGDDFRELRVRLERVFF